jgi:hypothetical protein
VFELRAGDTATATATGGDTATATATGGDTASDTATGDDTATATAVDTATATATPEPRAAPTATPIATATTTASDTATATASDTATATASDTATPTATATTTASDTASASAIRTLQLEKSALELEIRGLAEANRQLEAELQAWVGRVWTRFWAVYRGFGGLKRRFSGPGDDFEAIWAEKWRDLGGVEGVWRGCLNRGMPFFFFFFFCVGVLENGVLWRQFCSDGGDLTGIGTALISPFERCRLHCHRATATCAALPALGTCLYMFWLMWFMLLVLPTTQSIFVQLRWFWYHSTRLDLVFLMHPNTATQTTATYRHTSCFIDFVKFFDIKLHVSFIRLQLCQYWSNADDFTTIRTASISSSQRHPTLPPNHCHSHAPTRSIHFVTFFWKKCFFADIL